MNDRRMNGWLIVAEWFGCGRSPKAPGTVGSAGAIPLAYALCQAPLWLGVLGALVVSGLGIVASEQASRILGDKDPQSVVIDEVAGVVIAFLFVREAPALFLIVPWLLFRLFDIWKPGPIYRVQFLKPAGLGIMADDLLAGLVAGALSLGLLQLLPALS